MPRNISFAMTTDQIRRQTKTVTRRLGWWKNKRGRQMVKVGDVLNGCVKCMGLRPGEQIQRLGQVEIVDIRREPLLLMETCNRLGNAMCDAWGSINELNYPSDYGNIESAKEGFPDMTGSEFVRMFCQRMKVEPSEEVTRIEFKYLVPACVLA